MKLMNDKIFLDSNILVYSSGQNSPKKDICIKLIKQDFFISTQVINEFINTKIKKFKDDKIVVFGLAYEFMQSSSLVIIKPDLYKITERIFVKYGYSFYDSMIIAAALESECSILYSEDLSHN